MRNLDTQTISQTPDNELAGILSGQKVEIGWWKDAPTMETVHDIEKQVREGNAVRVPDKGVGYQISPGVKEEFKALERNTKFLMEEIAEKWIKLLQERQVDIKEIFLRITSLARTTAYQEKLIQQGYPAAANSTHAKLGAFDILTSWFEANRPDLLKALTEVLKALSKENRINFIKESKIGVYHVAFNRTSIQ